MTQDLVNLNREQGRRSKPVIFLVQDKYIQENKDDVYRNKGDKIRR